MRQADTLLASLLFALAAAGAVMAHGTGGQHVMGTLTAVAEGAIEVKDKAGKTVSIALDAKTEYLKLEGKNQVAATREDLEVERRVAVDVAEKGEALAATRVVIGAKVATKESHEQAGGHH